ncbi:MAG: zinc-dependent metalloprotease [Actinomycetota bacterium]|nr:zinc-dependent metalloprotease [Actinomycetota bacterium]
MADKTGALPLATRAGRILQRFGFSLFSGGDGLIDWYEVSGTAIDVGGEDWSQASVDPGAAGEFEEYVNRVSPHVAEFTGLSLAKPLPAPVIFNRSEWIVTAVTNLRPLLESLLGGILEHPTHLLRAAIGAEIGLVIGYLSGRVLGQYDSPLMGGAAGRGSIYFIHPNILEAERRLALAPRDFRLWLALHEVTHGFQLEANPWIKDYLKELIEEQAGYLRARLAREAGNGILFAKHLRRLISPEENPMMAKAQALMSVLEGYSEYVMETAGVDIIGDSSDIAAVLDEARRSKSRPYQLIERLIGLDIKMRQYRSGYLFIKQAADAGGMSLANLVWRGPGNMPTLTELSRPDLWIARMFKTQ